MALAPGLYVAATPIGNLKDVTYRVIEALKEADLILCEDTRETAKLCAAYAVATPRAPYHDHNAEAVRPGILEKLKGGARICLVSDAGTPLISDPGFKLVRAAREAGVSVVPLPGPSAAIAALSVSGAPTDRFVFAGFPPAKAGPRKAFLRELRRIEATLVFYETGPRLADSLVAMAEEFGGERPATIAREMTKIHEEFRDGALYALAARYRNAPPKGEIVVLVHPPAPHRQASEDDIDRLLLQLMLEGGASVKDAAESAAELFDVPRREAYDRALALKGK